MRTEKIKEFKNGKINVEVIKTSHEDLVVFSVNTSVDNKLGHIKLDEKLFDTKRKLNNYLKRYEETQ